MLELHALWELQGQTVKQLAVLELLLLLLLCICAACDMH
jgi:hypothetical protein